MPEGVRDASQCHISRGGDRTPIPRAIDHPNLILPLHLTPGNTYDLYLYVTTEGAYQLPVEFVDQTTLTHSSSIMVYSGRVLRGHAGHGALQSHSIFCST